MPNMDGCCIQFHYLSFTGKFLTIIALVSAALSALCVPLISILFSFILEIGINYRVNGTIHSVYKVIAASQGGYNWTNSRNDSGTMVYNSINSVSVKIIILLLINFLLLLMSMTILQSSAHKQVLKASTTYYRSLFNKYLSWLDNYTNKFQFKRTCKYFNFWKNGIGEKLGMIVQGFVMSICSLTICIIFGGHISLIFLSILPVIIIISATSREMRRCFYRWESEAYAPAEEHVSETLLNFKSVVAYSCQSVEIDRYIDLQRKSKRLAMHTGSFYGFVMSILWFGLFSCYITVFEHITRTFFSGMQYSPRDLFIVLFNIHIFFASLLRVPVHVGSLFHAHFSASQIHKAINGTGKNENNEKNETKNIDGVITFDNVWFSNFTSSDKPVLQGVSFQVGGGGLICLAGHCGSGKSACLDLISGLYIPDSGKVLLDGVEVRSLGLAAQHGIAFVPRGAAVLGTTFWDAINAGTEASHLDVVEAARAVDIHDHILKMERGYHCPLPTTLESETLARLALARALATQPRILLLDDALRDLPSRREAELLKRLAQRRTVVVATRRVATLRAADTVVLLAAGHVVGQGSWSDLRRQGSLRFAMAAAIAPRPNRQDSAFGFALVPSSGQHRPRDQQRERDGTTMVELFRSRYKQNEDEISVSRDGSCRDTNVHSDVQKCDIPRDEPLHPNSELPRKENHDPVVNRDSARDSSTTQSPTRVHYALPNRQRRRNSGTTTDSLTNNVSSGTVIDSDTETDREVDFTDETESSDGAESWTDCEKDNDDVYNTLLHLSPSSSSDLQKSPHCEYEDDDYPRISTREQMITWLRLVVFGVGTAAQMLAGCFCATAVGACISFYAMHLGYILRDNIIRLAGLEPQQTSHGGALYVPVPIIIIACAIFLQEHTNAVARSIITRHLRRRALGSAMSAQNAPRDAEDVRRFLRLLREDIPRAVTAMVEGLSLGCATLGALLAALGLAESDSRALSRAASVAAPCVLAGALAHSRIALPRSLTLAPEGLRQALVAALAQRRLLAATPGLRPLFASRITGMLQAVYRQERRRGAVRACGEAVVIAAPAVFVTTVVIAVCALDVDFPSDTIAPTLARGIIQAIMVLALGFLPLALTAIAGSEFRRASASIRAVAAAAAKGDLLCGPPPPKAASSDHLCDYDDGFADPSHLLYKRESKDKSLSEEKIPAVTPDRLLTPLDLPLARMKESLTSWATGKGRVVAVVGTGCKGTTMAPDWLIDALAPANFFSLDAERTRARMALVEGARPRFFRRRTVAANIAYGALGLESMQPSVSQPLKLLSPRRPLSASIDEVIEAAQQAGIHDFIYKLPEGYFTSTGKAAARMDATQLLQLAVARALLHDPVLLLVDGLPVHANPQQQEKAENALADAARGRTVVLASDVVTPAVSRADLILVLEADAQLSEHGTHETLLEAHGLYYRMCRRQERLEHRSCLARRAASSYELKRPEAKRPVACSA